MLTLLLKQSASHIVQGMYDFSTGESMLRLSSLLEVNLYFCLELEFVFSMYTFVII